MASANQGQNGAKHTSGYGLTAAVTATPTTRNERPFTTRQSGGVVDVPPVHIRVLRVIWSPTSRSSASAKPASSTAPPSRTQPPWVSSGRSTEDVSGSRPTAHTPAAPPTAGYGPLWSTTPEASASASKPARSAGPLKGSGPTLATTSGPAVASRVSW